MALKQHIVISTILALSAGCVVGSDQYPAPGDLSERWLVDRPRLLAVRADPPEAGPGVTVSFEALLPDPTEQIESIIWMACPWVEVNTESPVGCLPSDAEDTGSLSDVIGMQPGFDPVFSVPDNALDDLEDPIEGGYISIQVIGAPAIDLQPDEELEIDLAAYEIGTKRLVVSQATTPNSNPELVDFTVDGVIIPNGESAVVGIGQTVELGITITPESVEEYEFTNASGKVEHRAEEPYGSWYSTCGRVEEHITIHPYNSSTWTADNTSGSGIWWVVVRDRRGGMTWATKQFRVE